MLSEWQQPSSKCTMFVCEIGFQFFSLHWKICSDNYSIKFNTFSYALLLFVHFCLFCFYYSFSTFWQSAQRERATKRNQSARTWLSRCVCVSVWACVRLLLVHTAINNLLNMYFVFAIESRSDRWLHFACIVYRMPVNFSDRHTTPNTHGECWATNRFVLF